MDRSSVRSLRPLARLALVSALAASPGPACSPDPSGDGGPSGEACDNREDDDGDGLVDCDDAKDCRLSAACARAEDCSNELDDDHDTAVDCGDADCAGAPGCGLAEDCGNQSDDDGDGKVDCQDPSCVGTAACDGSADDPCAAPIAAALGSTSGDTSGGTRVARGTCAGGNQRERVLTFTPPADGTLHLVLTSQPDLAFYVRSTCQAMEPELACRDQQFGGAQGGSPEAFDLAVTGGQPLFIYVDGSEDATGDILGPFTLELSLQ